MANRSLGGRCVAGSLPWLRVPSAIGRVGLRELELAAGRLGCEVDLSVKARHRPRPVLAGEGRAGDVGSGRIMAAGDKISPPPLRSPQSVLEFSHRSREFDTRLWPN